MVTVNPQFVEHDVTSDDDDDGVILSDEEVDVTAAAGYVTYRVSLQTQLLSVCVCVCVTIFGR